MFLKGGHGDSLRLPAWVAPPFWRPFSLSCLILALLGAILDHLGALKPHLFAKLVQDGAQMAQHSAKTGQNDLQEDPQIEKTSVSDVLSSFFGFHPFWKDRAQDAIKMLSCHSK